MERTPYEFKFKFVNAEGQEEGFLSKKASFDGELLVLDEASIPVAALLEVDHRGNRMILGFVTDEDQPSHIVFAITSGSAPKLKELLGRARSEAWAKARREQLEKEGRGHEYHEVNCPHCDAVIDLTGKPESPQVSCDFCHTVGTIDDADGVIREESQYRLCDSCGMYSKPRKFTIFYFYFLLVVYGFRSSSTWRCPACMRPEAWKMLFGNLIFVLGVPVAIVQLIRSYGGTDIGSLYPGLDSANLKARGQNLEGAIAGYRKILEKQPNAAGVKYNIALAFLQRNELDNAAQMLEASLADCANYRPAANVLAGCYRELGRTEDLAILKAQWGADEEDQDDAVEVDVEEVE